jgi:hypothetical protein
MDGNYLTYLGPRRIRACMKTTPKDLHRAMADLRAGRITPDEFRAVMRASRENNGTQGHDAAMFKAAAALNRS